MSISGGYGNNERSWPYGYGALARVRDAIAAAMGIENRRDHYADRFTDYALLGFWVDPETTIITDDPILTPEDDIEYLMLHQDCEGILMPWTSRRIAARLKDILVHVEDDEVWNSKSTRKLTVELLDLLEWAGEDGVLLEFT